MLVKWNGEGLLGVSLIGGEGSKESTGVEVLLPGWNEISDENWALMALHLKDKIESEKIVLYGKKEADKATGAITYSGQALRDVRADLARDIVKECYSVKCLKVWVEDPKLSSEVRFLVDKQIEYCMKGEGPTPGKKQDINGRCR